MPASTRSPATEWVFLGCTLLLLACFVAWSVADAWATDQAGWRNAAQLRVGLFALLVLGSCAALGLWQHRRRYAGDTDGDRTREADGFLSLPIDLLCVFAPDGRFLKLNPAWEQVLGYRLAELEGMPSSDLVHPDYRAATAAAAAELAAGRPVSGFVNRYRTRSGDYRYIEWRAAPGADHRIYAAARDITASHERERQLKAASARAEADGRAKSAFLADMRHAIHVPMNAVLRPLDLLQHTTLDEQQRDYADKTQSAALSLLAILDDLVDFSEDQMGQMTPDPAPFSLGELLRELSLTLSACHDNSQLEVLFQIAPGIPRRLLGDGPRLRQVLLNLASNAIKSTPRGEVMLALQLQQAGPESVRIAFSVRDTGIGIPADRLAAILDESPTARHHDGTGLGLAISQRLVRLMGGELAVDSKPGRGSRFHFTLEFARAGEAGEADRAPAGTATTTPALRVLIVDDNAIARDVLASMARSFGWQATTANSGDEAIATLQQAAAAGHPYDVLCIDWIMPGLDGWDTVRQIRVTQGDRQPPAILLLHGRGRELLAKRLDGQDNPCDGFLVKPVTPAMLFDAVADVTRGGSVPAERRAVRREPRSP